VPVVASTRTPAARLAVVICVAEILGMTPFSMFLAIQTGLKAAWALSNTEVGWISSSYYAGYLVAVPVLVSLTDRIDARTIWLAATSLAAGAAIGFGLLADGMRAAVVCQAVAGASLAGTYMPGLKLIADRTDGVPHPRYVAFYTTSFTVGASLSFYLVGRLAALMSWRSAVVAAAAGPAIAWALAYLMLDPAPPAASSAVPEQRHWRTLLRSRDSLRFVFGYACHCWELFGLRAWLVPFLVFCQTVQGRGTIASASTLAAVIALVGVPASLAGAELSARYDPRRIVFAIMLLSAATSVAVGLTSMMPWVVILAVSVIYSALVSADSAALTAGLVAVSPPGSRGTAMALYSMAGFAAASAGSAAVGGLLDLLGGESVRSWTIALAALGAANLLGAAILRSQSST
jgi:predicted MFS family arabinose efflux permease